MPSDLRAVVAYNRNQGIGEKLYTESTPAYERPPSMKKNHDSYLEIANRFDRLMLLVELSIGNIWYIDCVDHRRHLIY